ncbi:MAG: hypothetical protein ACFFCD_05325 [Promethearchaeota archaeon]
MSQIIGIGEVVSFSGINITVSVISLAALISTITVIVYTLKQILESVVGVQLYYNFRFFCEYLLHEVKTFCQMIVGHFKPASGLEIEKE